MAKTGNIENINVLKKAIKEATPPDMIRVNEGLYLQITGNGATSWLFRFQLNGKRRAMGLGSFPEISLADAAADAATQRALVARGIDPIEHKRAQEAAEAAESAREAALRVSFDTCADDYITRQALAWKSPKQAPQWRSSLKAYASPTIGTLPPAEITTAHALEILTPIWHTIPETASRVRNRCELIWDSAKAKNLCSGENPFRWRGHLSTILPKRAKVRKVKHFNALPWQDVPAFWRTLRASPGYGSQALALTILTACRTSEVLQAEWSEFDFKTKTWTIPAERMKARRVHRVPLSDAAIAILKEQQGQHERWVFPGRNGPVSNMAMLMKLRRMKRADVTAHGFRSSFRDWCAEETHYPRDVCEMALAHTIESDVEAAYRRGDLLERRRTLMADWATFVTRETAANVVKMRRRKAK